MNKEVRKKVYLVAAGLTLIITGIANAQDAAMGAAMRELYLAAGQVATIDINAGGYKAREITGALYDGVCSNDKSAAGPVHLGYNEAPSRVGTRGTVAVKSAEEFNTSAEKNLEASKDKKPDADAEIAVDHSADPPDSSDLLLAETYNHEQTVAQHTGRAAKGDNSILLMVVLLLLLILI